MHCTVGHNDKKCDKNIQTIEDFQEAKNSKRSETVDESSLEPVIDIKSLGITPTENVVKIYDGKQTFEVTPSEDEDLLSQLKFLAQNEPEKWGNLLPEHECDGLGTCGTCVMRIVDRNGVDEKESINFERSELDLLRINKIKSGLLCCQHSGDELKNRVLYYEPINNKI